MRWMQITAAIPSTTTFSMQRPVCAEGICGVTLPNWSCSFCWFKWNIHISSKRCTMKILLVILTILTYTYFLIKKLVTSGRPLMVLSGFLRSSSPGSALTVFLSQVRATDSCSSTVPSPMTNTSQFSQPLTELSSDLSVSGSKACDCPWLCIMLSSPEHSFARAAKQRPASCQKESSRNH